MTNKDCSVLKNKLKRALQILLFFFYLFCNIFDTRVKDPGGLYRDTDSIFQKKNGFQILMFKSDPIRPNLISGSDHNFISGSDLIIKIGSGSATLFAAVAAILKKHKTAQRGQTCRAIFCW